MTDGEHIKVLLADDHTLMREMTRQLLEQAGMEVVGEASNGDEAVMLTQERRPHVVLMDIAMPRLNGVDATRQIKERCPSVAVLVLTAYEDDQYVVALLEAGAAGYLLKTVRTSELVEAIGRVHAGEAVLHPRIARKVLQYFAGKPAARVSRSVSVSKGERVASPSRWSWRSFASVRKLCATSRNMPVRPESKRFYPSSRLQSGLLFQTMALDFRPQLRFSRI